MTALPDITDYTDSGRTEGQIKSFMTDFRAFCAGLLGTDGVPATGLAALGGIGTVVEDTTPQQGGFLDTNDFSIWLSKGAPIVAASSCDIWANADGNTIHITGNTNIDDFATAPNAGAIMYVIFDGTPDVVDSATITVDGNVDFTAAANDMGLVYAETTTTFKFKPMPNDGKAVIQDIRIGEWEHLSTTALTTATEFDSALFATGFDYKWEIQDFAPTSDGQALWMRFSDDNGITFEEDVDDYGWGALIAAVNGQDVSDAKIAISSTVGFGNDATNVSNIEIIIINPGGTDVQTNAKWNGFLMTTDPSPAFSTVIGGGRMLTTVAVTNARVLWAGGSTFKAQGNIIFSRRLRA